MNSRIAPSTSRSTSSGSRSAAIASMSRRWYALSSLSASSDRPAPLGRRAGAAPAQHAAQRGHPAEGLGRLEHPVALDAPVHLGPLAELVGEVHLVPAGDPPGRHAGVEQLVGAAQEGVQRLRRVPLLERPVRELGEIPRGRRALEAVPELRARRARRAPRSRRRRSVRARARPAARRTARASRRGATSAVGSPSRSP